MAYYSRLTTYCGATHYGATHHGRRCASPSRRTSPSSSAATSCCTSSCRPASATPSPSTSSPCAPRSITAAAQALRPIRPPARPASARSSSGRPPASARLAGVFWPAGHTDLVCHTGAHRARLAAARPPALRELERRAHRRQGQAPGLRAASAAVGLGLSEGRLWRSCRVVRPASSAEGGEGVSQSHRATVRDQERCEKRRGFGFHFSSIFL